MENDKAFLNIQPCNFSSAKKLQIKKNNLNNKEGSGKRIVIIVNEMVENHSKQMSHPSDLYENVMHKIQNLNENKDNISIYNFQGKDLEPISNFQKKCEFPDNNNFQRKGYETPHKTFHKGPTKSPYLEKRTSIFMKNENKEKENGTKCSKIKGLNDIPVKLRTDKKCKSTCDLFNTKKKKRNQRIYSIENKKDTSNNIISMKINEAKDEDESDNNDKDKDKNKDKNKDRDKDRDKDNKKKNIFKKLLCCFN